MELTFIILDLLGILVSLGYFKCGQRSSALLTLLLSALLLIRVTWIRIIGAVLVILITLCFILFRTTVGAAILKAFGRDPTGRKPDKK